MAAQSKSKKSERPAPPLNIDSLLQPGRLAGAGASTYRPLPTEPYPAWASGEGEDKPQPSPPAPTPKPYEPLPREPDTRDGKPGENKIIVPREKKVVVDREQDPPPQPSPDPPSQQPDPQPDQPDPQHQREYEPLPRREFQETDDKPPHQ